MNKPTLLGLIVALMTLQTVSLEAQKKPLEINKLTSDPSLNPSKLKLLQWEGSGSSLSYWNQNTLIRVDMSKNRIDSSLTLEKINAQLQNDALTPLDNVPKYHYVNQETIGFFHDHQYVHFNLNTARLTRVASVPENSSNPTLSPNFRGFTYLFDTVLMLINDGMKYRISEPTKLGVRDGIVPHRSEFGANTGVIWSNDNSIIAYYQIDESHVTSYPLVNINSRIATLQSEPYPMAGMKSQHASVHLFNTTNFTRVALKTGIPKDQYLTNLCFSPDNKTVYIAHVNREQNRMELKSYESATGLFLQTLFTEDHPRYVEPQQAPYFLPQDKTHFLWLSERDGYRHLYLYNTQGNLIRQVSQGSWVVKDIVGISPKGERVYFTATKDGALHTHLYATTLFKEGPIERITQDNGTHQVKMSGCGLYFIDTYSSVSVPNQSRVIDNKGRILRVLHTAENPLESYQGGQVELCSLTAADGQTELYGRMIKPYNFDPTQRYPVLIYVYGGPHSQMVTNSWLCGANPFFMFLAQQGYLVFTLDNRGTAHRGFEFSSCTHRQLGVIEMADQLKGVEYLKSLPYVDSLRLAVDGWSYGGFMSLTLMLKNPGLFKVATAGGPVVDWKWYEVMYGERYMDTPEENPDGYRQANLLNVAENLDGKLMIIHGAMDPVVVWQQSLALIDRFVKLNKPVDYFVYPNYEHNVRGLDRRHLYQKLYDYYRANL